MGNPYEKNMPPAPADHGFVAMISPTKLVDRINHAVAIENVQVEGLVGNDTFAFDDNVAGDTTNVSGGVGDDKFFVGQIFGEAKALGFDTGLPVTPATKCRGDLDNLTPARCIGLRDSTVGIGDPSDWFGLRDTTRGFLSNGVTHPATLNGGDGNDFFQVYSNQAKLIMNGDNDDDTFILRAFALEGSKSAAIMEQLGVPMEVNLGAGVDYVEYAKNAAVEVHGGDGFDTLMFVGTEFQDGILVSNGTAQICHVKDLEKGILDTDECSFETVLYDEIESVGIQALGGNDLILILSTGTPGGDRTQMKVFGGEHDDVIYIGRDNTSEYSKKWLHGGDLSGIQDPVTVYGESDPLFDEDISTAITLPGETAGTAEPPSPLAGGTKFGDVGIIDATQHNAGVTGRIDQIKQDDVDVQNLTGFGMGTGATIKGVTLPGGVVFNAIDFVDVRLGQGNDSFVVEKTDDIKRDLNGDDELEDIPGFLSTAGVLNATPAKVLYGAEVVPLLISGNNGSDTISLKTADAAVRVVGGAGDDVVNVGSVMPAKPGTLETIHALVDVIGGIGTDTLNLDDSADTESQKLSVRQASVHGLGLHPLGVTYAELETLDVDMGTANEVANVRGTSATTTIHGNAGDERYYVSDVANLDQDTTTDHLLGTLDDIDGALTLDSGAGRHLLMVSDEDTATGDTAAVINATSITGLAPAGITYTTSGSWADGVTVWASQHDDTINLDSTHLTPGVRTVSTLNAGDGNDALTVDLVDGVDGFSVVNGEEGNDTINGASSTLPLVLFGGPGNDDIDGGHAADIVLGDLGWVRYGAADETVLGGGGPGDRTDGVIRPVEQIESRSLATGGTDDIATGDGNDVAFGGTGNDTMDSGANDDVALGDAGEYRRTWPAPQYRSTGHLDAIGGNDTINAGDGRDFVLGQHGNDAIDGGPADDVIAGGHNLAGGLDGADVVHGGSGRDVISGDNAKLDWTPPWRLYDVATVSNPTPPTGSGSGDELHGDDGDDVIFGQAGNDLISGDSGLDDIEGNAGSDNITGNAGQDNIAGGGSANDGLIVTTRIGTGLLDSADTIDGGDDADVIGGDNIRILRVLTATGAPVVDAANGSFVRDIRHFDVAIVGGPAVPSSTNGGDTIDSGGQDDIVFSQGGNDTTRGGAGDDWLEGNDGLDTVFGGGGSDDVLGGGSANDGIIIPTRTGKGLLDDGDRLFGDSRANAGGDADDGHDVVLGDNGRIDRPRLSNGTWTMLNPVAGATYANRVLRVVVMADASPGATSGSDYMRGNGGEDDLYGQFDDGSSSTLAGVGCIDNELVPGAIAGDLICGDAGEDGIVADQGTIVSVKAENMSASAQRVQTNSPFIDETIYARGTVVRVVTLSPIAVGGDDVVFGGDGRDSIHAGAGDDMANAGPGDDAIFGGDGADALWGDIGHDRAYGGFGTDFIDVKPRANVAGIANDGPRWFVVAPFVDRDNVKASTNWSDTHYGGWDADALQADEGGAGPRPGDRLVDWQGAYNVFYVCEGAYGAGRILREFSPNMHDVWQQLAAGDGATTVTVEGASGEVELALVANKEIKDNTNPRHPDHPGHFTCEGS
jgi:Ca2+-binding RTX toxin-like protein